jgi:hypothetical protein
MRERTFLWIKHNHHKKNIIENLNKDMRLIKRVTNQVSYMCYLLYIKPKKVDNSQQDESWIKAMHEKLN